MGRCADFVLKDYDNVLSVFIHAPHEYCMEQAALKHGGMSAKEIEKLIQKTDKQRAEYYKYYTGREWTDARNYDLCLDSSKLGFDRCVEEIISYMENECNWHGTAPNEKQYLQAMEELEKLYVVEE